MAYIQGEKPQGCVLCVPAEASAKAFVLHRGARAFVMMNLYPYTSGHLMVVPDRHVALLEELTPEERLEIFDLTTASVEVLKKAFHPEGINIGINLGPAAGAGVEDHVHVHIVPRWCGDTNFMSVIGDVRVIPEDIARTWGKLLPYFRDAFGEEK